MDSDRLQQLQLIAFGMIGLRYGLKIHVHHLNPDCNYAPLRFRFELPAVVLAHVGLEAARIQEVTTAVDRAVGPKSEVACWQE